MASLTIKQINKTFKNLSVLKDINIATADGELVVILGPSGCGKSTLLRIIAGLEEADSGELLIDEKRIDNLIPRKRNTALVFQNYALYPHMTVEKNLAFPLKVAGIKKSEIKTRVLETAEMLDLQAKLSAYPAELSGGQRQRVALGRAIIREPDLFLLDEPLSNLDADLRNKMRREIVALQKKLGVTTLYVTHDQIEALTMADRMVVLNDGIVQQIGTVDQVYNNPANTFVAQFIGTPKMNLVPAKVDAGLIKPFNLSQVLIPAKYSVRELVIGIRPEDILLDPNGKFIAQVLATEYLGDKSVLTLRFIDHTILAIAEPNRFAIDDDITFSIKSDMVCLFDKETGMNVSAQ